MLEALWSVEFESSAGYVGAGVVVFETSRIFGGDNQYYYTGKYDLQGGELNAYIKVTHYSEGSGSIFGTNEKEFELKLSGKVEQPVMTGRGSRIDNPNAQMNVRLTKRAELP